MKQRERLEQWFLHYSDDVYKFLVYYTRQWDVEDLVQEVFIKAMKNMDSFEGRAQPKTWLLTIARNTAIDFLRKQRLRQWLPDSMLHNVAAVERTPEDVLQLNEQKRELLGAVHQLKQSYQDVLILRGIKGLSTGDTAAILNWSETKVSITLHRAMKALKQRLGNNVKEMIGDVL